MLMQTQISFGKSIYKPDTLEDVPISYVLDTIRENAGIKNACASIRQHLDNPALSPAERKEFKKIRDDLKKTHLPFVTWAGTFYYRSNENMKQASGLACLDFDEYDKADTIIKDVVANPYTFIAFRTPSNGVKAIVRIPLVKNDFEYKQYYQGLLEKYSNAKTDESGKDIARACFLSHDANAYINENSKIFIQEEKHLAPSLLAERKEVQKDPITKETLNLPQMVQGIEVKELRRILSHISPQDYSVWMKVCINLKAASDNLFPLFNEWSSQSSSYTSEDECFLKWQSTSKTDHSWGFLPIIKLARDNGYSHENDIQQSNLKASFETRTMLDYSLLDKNNDFIVDGFLYPETVVMLYSPPAHFKSLISLYLAMCISNGLPFNKYQTKKSSVLYFDGENSDQIMKTRLAQIQKGMDGQIDLESPLYFAKSGVLFDSKKNIGHEFVKELNNFCEEKGVKVIVFDTLHRFAFYDENSSDDVNMLYTMVFKPLQEKGITVLFLHHSTKAGDYRGSGDFLGMVDCCYNVVRKKGTDTFCLANQKSRNGEIDNIYGNITFEEDEISFNFNAEAPVQDLGKLKQITEKIELIIHEGGYKKRKEIMDRLEKDSIEHNSKTVDRSLKFLLEEKGTILKNERREYYAAGPGGFLE